MMDLRAHLHRTGRRLADLAFPPLCPVCTKRIAEPGSLCAACWGDISWIERPFCHHLGTPFAFDMGPDALSASAIADPQPFDRCRSACLYGKTSARLVHALKYKDRLETATVMAGPMARIGRDILRDADLLVPVPLHARRLWSRRYNQAALLADALSKRSGLAWDPKLLARIRATGQQVGLARKDRAANVRGAFRVPANRTAELARKHVVLIDDVITSGATIAACARALKRGGAARLDVLTFARVVGESEGYI